MSADAGARFFHGTFATLTPGDVLRTGDDLGLTHHGRSRHVYGTCSEFDTGSLDWLDGWDTAENRLAHAIEEAIEWAAHAADALCPDLGHRNPGDEYGFHHECVFEGSVPACLRVYEIVPVGPVEPDPSSDPGPSAVMMGSARVLAPLDLRDRPVGHFSYEV